MKQQNNKHEREVLKMTCYIDILNDGTLTVSLIETLVNRTYGNEKQYVKHRITASYLGDNCYFEDRSIVSTVWNWKTKKHYCLSNKNI
jgi:hypothetical protein